VALLAAHPFLGRLPAAGVRQQLACMAALLGVDRAEATRLALQHPQLLASSPEWMEERLDTLQSLLLLERRQAVTLVRQAPELLDHAHPRLQQPGDIVAAAARAAEAAGGEARPPSVKRTARTLLRLRGALEARVGFTQAGVAMFGDATGAAFASLRGLEAEDDGPPPASRLVGLAGRACAVGCVMRSQQAAASCVLGSRGVDAAAASLAHAHQSHMLCALRGQQQPL
jgi:hypothetical protein